MQENILKEMWRRKSERLDVWAHGELTETVEMIEYTDRESGYQARPYQVQAGTTVLITMLSRFGDVGIRAHDISKKLHGYHGRVDPAVVTNVRFI